MKSSLILGDEKVIRDISDNTYVTDKDTEKYCDTMASKYMTVLKSVTDSNTYSSFSQIVTMEVKLAELEEAFNFEFNFRVDADVAPAKIGYSFISVERIDCNTADEMEDGGVTSIEDVESHIQEAMYDIVVSFCVFLTDKLDKIKSAYDEGVKSALKKHMSHTFVPKGIYDDRVKYGAWAWEQYSSQQEPPEWISVMYDEDTWIAYVHQSDDNSGNRMFKWIEENLYVENIQSGYAGMSDADFEDLQEIIRRKTRLSVEGGEDIASYNILHGDWMSEKPVK